MFSGLRASEVERPFVKLSAYGPDLDAKPHPARIGRAPSVCHEEKKPRVQGDISEGRLSGRSFNHGEMHI